MITISSEAEVALIRLTREMDAISSKDSPTGKEKRRFDALKTQISLIKNGLNPSAIVGADIARLEEDIRGFSVGRHLPFEAEVDWRSFITGTAKRRYESAGRHEVRAVQEAGTQSISYSNADGSNFVPVGFQDRQLVSKRQYDQIFDDRFHNRIDTETGNPTQLPSFDDVNNAAVQVGENTSPYGTETTAGQAPTVAVSYNQLNAYSFRSGYVSVSYESLQDAGTPWGELLERAFAIRMARGVGKALVLGSGSSAPQGLLTGIDATTSPEIIAAGANPNSGNSGDNGASSIGSQDLENVYFGLNTAYRGNAAWYMTAETLHTISQVLDKVGRPLVKYNSDQEATLYNKPICICPNFPQISPNAPVIAFGSPDYFCVRHVARGFYVKMLTQAPGYVENGLVAFQSYERYDSTLVVPNLNFPPYVQLVMHS